MKKFLALFLFPIASMVSPLVYAVPGEYWEIKVTSDMGGMPGMPSGATPFTMKQCMPNDRNYFLDKMNKQDKDCKLSNIKKSANNASFDITCNHDGEIMKGHGEFTLHGDTEEGTSHMSGKVQGHDMNMTQTTKVKRIGGSCDTEAEEKKVNDRMNANKAYAEKMMQDSKANTEAACANWEKDYAWVAVPDYYFGDQAMCAGKAVKLCEALRKDVTKNVKVYDDLNNIEKQPGRRISVIKECKVDMAAATKSICKTPMDNSNYETLSKYCPAEAKAFREVQRKKDCEGRSYTGVPAAEVIKRCMSGDEGGNSSGSSNSGNANSTEKPVKDGTSDVLDSATKLLKGHFGF